MGDQQSMDVGNVRWFWFATNAFAVDKRWRRIMRRLPRDPRGKFCNTPFEGMGGVAAREFPGGAEVPMSILFADIRGSTPLSEQMSATEFSRLINRFYTTTTKAVIELESRSLELKGIREPVSVRVRHGA